MTWRLRLLHHLRTTEACAVAWRSISFYLVTRHPLFTCILRNGERFPTMAFLRLIESPRFRLRNGGLIDSIASILTEIWAFEIVARKNSICLTTHSVACRHLQARCEGYARTGSRSINHANVLSNWNCIYLLTCYIKVLLSTCQFGSRGGAVRSHVFLGNRSHKG